MKAESKSKEKKKVSKVTVPVASEVQPGWWVGGCYSNQLNMKWAGVIDLTVEFPERCHNDTLRYLCLPTWDGVPASSEQLEKAGKCSMYIFHDAIYYAHILTNELHTNNKHF